MAKKKKQKKSVSQKQKQTVRRFPLKTIIIAAAAVVVTAALAVFLVAVNRQESEKYALHGTQWLSHSAKNASGDEVDIREVYNVRYSQYQGSLTFDDENGFELWLQPGDASDGTHSGKYEIEGDSANVTFDDGTAATFRLTRSGNDISAIEVNYEEYAVLFTKAQ